MDDVNTYLADVVEADRQSMLVIFDNYVMQRWLKRLISDKQFTQQLATMSVLLRTLSTPDGEETTIEEAQREYFVPVDWDLMTAKLVAGEVILKAPPEIVSKQRDHDCKRQSVADFRVYPSVPGRSSVESGIRTLVFDDILIDKCNLVKKICYTVQDTEIAFPTYILQLKYRKKYGNLVLLPSIWHYKMHLLRNTIGEPVNRLLFWDVLFIELFSVQVDKFTTDLIVTANKFEKFVQTQVIAFHQEE